jgi:orotate phosphoribosyltransferase
MPHAALKAELARAFVAARAFRFDLARGFKLASGVISPFYVDCRVIMAHPRPRHLVAELAFHALKAMPCQCLGGLELGAISIATAISAYGYTGTPHREWRTFVVRKQPKDHGLGKLIEGAAESGDRAVVVDDVLTSGGSVLRAVQAAREAGLMVTHALVIVDRKEQDGRTRVEQEGVTLISLLTIDDLRAALEAEQQAVPS